MRNTIYFLIVFVGGLLLGAYLGYQQDRSEGAGASLDSAMHAASHLVPGYVCPMHPAVTSDQPGSCPICGMDLEMRSTEADAASDEGVAVPANMSNSLGVRLAAVDTGRVSEPVFATGYIETVTPAKTTSLKVDVEGSVIRAHAAPGDWVSKGDALLEIDAPVFVETQNEYYEAMRTSDYEKSMVLREKLADMGASPAVLAGIDPLTGLPPGKEYVVRAPHAGEVEWLSDEESVRSGEMVARISTPVVASTRLRSYARAARAVKPGRRAQLDLPHLPDQYWPGKVVKVKKDDAGFYSIIEADFEIPEGAGEPGTFVGAYVNAGTNEGVLRVPASAVIRLQDGARVIQALGKGRYQPVPVETGYIGNEWAVILSGLSEGDTVVERAQFLIDSEATLRAGLLRLGDE